MKNYARTDTRYMPLTTLGLSTLYNLTSFCVPDCINLLQTLCTKYLCTNYAYIMYEGLSNYLRDRKFDPVRNIKESIKI